jgi:hypothetical protein
MEARARLKTQRARLAQAEGTLAQSRKLVQLMRKRVELTKRRIRSKEAGAKATRYLVRHVGRTETATNDAPFLRGWEEGLPHNRLDWMIPGQPWCGFACIAAWYFGAQKELPDGTVYTPNIVNWAKQGVHYKSVPASEAKPGDLVVFNFPGGEIADHVGLARDRAVNGLIPTVEGNTSSSNGGSQANGGGVYLRQRPVSLVAVVARPL